MGGHKDDSDGEVPPAVTGGEDNVKFSTTEKKHIAFFIGGIMCFKFAFESLGGAVNLFVLDRISGGSVTTLALLVIFYGVAQSIGSMVVSQLVAVFRASRVIAFFLALFAALASLYIFLEAITGGTLDKDGSWNPYGIFPIYICMGGCLGAMELIRRIIPGYIVGYNADKLKKMDATVHIFYEVAGTCGAFTSTALIEFLGPVYGTILLPPLFSIGAILYWQVRHIAPVRPPSDESERNKIVKICNRAGKGVKTYFQSLKLGATIVLGNRRFAWLMVGYVIPLVIHRIVENVLFSVFAKKVLKKGSLSQILLGGSNFGELCGAALVLRFSAYIRTPLPWVRLDAIALCVLWVFPYADASKAVPLAVGLIPVMMVLSGSWAAGDVSLLAYIQSLLPEDEETEGKISPIGSVMGFLYASYVLIVTGTVYGLGRAFDWFSKHGDIRDGFFWIAGVSITIISVFVFASTFVPKGSWHLNPTLEDLGATPIASPQIDMAVADEKPNKMASV